MMSAEIPESLRAVFESLDQEAQAVEDLEKHPDSTKAEVFEARLHLTLRAWSFLERLPEAQRDLYFSQDWS